MNMPSSQTRRSTAEYPPRQDRRFALAGSSLGGATPRLGSFSASRRPRCSGAALAAAPVLAWRGAVAPKQE
ncbi:hypothetical protein LCGC14_1709350 [marine sediment metagenome]|uniref:Uncharacterized protein n=1 Tax=marine sediment metagenome TaxID=412755 RepID=A0A0F9HF83_9ZZZZ